MRIDYFKSQKIEILTPPLVFDGIRDKAPAFHPSDVTPLKKNKYEKETYWSFM